MKIVFHSFYNQYNKDNLLFAKSNAEIGDDLLSPFLSIADKALLKKQKVCTSDNINWEEADAIVFVELPKKTDTFFIEAIKSGKPLYLITLESPIIMPENYIISNHKVFTNVFTWSDSLITSGDDRYIKINYSFNFPDELPKVTKSNKKLLTLISGNKKSSFNNELYSSREEVIKYMEKKYLNDFEFYGMGWDYFMCENRFFKRVLNKLKIPRKILFKNYISYKGKVERKNVILRQYAFSICYENVKDIPGYITEKIFDSFFAGCVPIYLGADNITQYIPSNCFIDRRDFTSIGQVYQFIKLMSDEVYCEYLRNIKIFLDSNKGIQFSNDMFADTIITTVIYNKKQEVI